MQGSKKYKDNIKITHFSRMFKDRYGLPYFIRMHCESAD